MRLERMREQLHRTRRQVQATSGRGNQRHAHIDEALTGIEARVSELEATVAAHLDDGGSHTGKPEAKK